MKKLLLLLIFILGCSDPEPSKYQFRRSINLPEIKQETPKDVKPEENVDEEYKKVWQEEKNALNDFYTLREQKNKIQKLIDDAETPEEALYWTKKHAECLKLENKAWERYDKALKRKRELIESMRK